MIFADKPHSLFTFAHHKKSRTAIGRIQSMDSVERFYKFLTITPPNEHDRPTLITWAYYSAFTVSFISYKTVYESPLAQLA